jgi:hypothetical protein
VRAVRFAPAVVGPIPLQFPSHGGDRTTELLGCRRCRPAGPMAIGDDCPLLNAQVRGDATRRPVSSGWSRSELSTIVDT